MSYDHARTRWQVRVIFGDTDQMGVVYYGNYLRFFEGARAELLRSLGHDHHDLDAWGVALPVVEAHVRYRRSAQYEDLLDIEVAVTQLGGASMTFEYIVWRGEQRLAEGFTRHAAVDLNGRPMRVPAPLRAIIEGSAT